MSRKEIADRYIGKILSRKLLVFIITTIGLFLGNIQSGDFVIIAGMYVGTLGAIEAIQKIKGYNPN